MAGDEKAPSARRAELLELAYQYAVQRGSTDLTLRPLAAAIGSSPRVLIYLFGSRDGLVRALLSRARADEVSQLAALRQEAAGGAGLAGAGLAGAGLAEAGLAEAGGRVWAWLADEGRRPLLRLWLDGYARSLSEPDGPWAGFARATVADWLALLGEFRAPRPAAGTAGADAEAGTGDETSVTELTLLLAVLRGALIDLLATDDERRVTASVRGYLIRLGRHPHQ
jgi:AcrR family transcriptional regulator